MTVFDHLLAVLTGLVLPGLGAFQSGRSDDSAGDTASKIAAYWSHAAVLVLLAGGVLAVWRYGGRSWSELGLRSPEQLGWGLLLALVFGALYTVDTLWQLAPQRLAATRERWRRQAGEMPATPREVRHSMAMVSAAAVCEEILYRGFLIGYLVHFTGASWPGLAVAVALPAAVFGLAHCRQGPYAGAKGFILASLLGAIFVVTGSLWIPMALHFLMDLVGMLLGPRLLAPGATR